ncbi:MAG: right-handed parallel beta-helix repeat-containing protein [Halioglobus sp.]
MKRVAHLLTGLALLFCPLATADNAQSEGTGPRIWQVGPEREIKVPSAAAKLARNGDTVEIDAARYYNDYAHWPQDNLTLRGVGGMAHMESDHLIPNGKAIWIITGDGVDIENMEFSGARVHSTNGAGIRHNGGDMRLHNTFFHHNEFSVMTGPSDTGKINISSSRFWFQRRGARWSHGIYIGNVKRFSITGSHIMGTDLGHQIKSRARENHILYNRIEDLAYGNASRLVDLPNCGLSIVMGNEMQQGRLTDNTDIIGYGAEGCDDRDESLQRLFVWHNTLINEAVAATLVRNHSSTAAFVANNLVYGRASFLAGGGRQENNLRLPLPQHDQRRWLPPAGSRAIDAAKMITAPPYASLPSREFQSPVGMRERARVGNPDIGAREAPENLRNSRH